MGVMRGGEPKGEMPAFTWIMIIALVCISGLRYWVGSDYGNYIRRFTQQLALPFSQIWQRTEPLDYLIVKFAGIFTNDYPLIFFLYAFLTVYFSVRPIARWANEICFGVLLFVLLTLFQVSFNAMRQMLAGAIVFAGHRYIYDRKLIKYLLVCYVASLVHISALIMIFPYFIATRKITKPQLLLILAIAIVGLLSYDRLFGIAEDIRGIEIHNTLFGRRRVKILRVLVAWAPAVLLYAAKGSHRWENLPNMDDEKMFYFNMLLLTAALATAGANSAYLGRVAFYPMLFSTIGIPMVIEVLPKRGRKWYMLITIILFLAYWYVDVSLMNRYRWIWTRPR
ncbi:MAG: EpsG family protein [Clostridiales bacterium]|nr:EpsG family protein [Clostridiales bacterium]